MYPLEPWISTLSCHLPVHYSQPSLTSWITAQCYWCIWSPISARGKCFHHHHSILPTSRCSRGLSPIFTTSYITFVESGFGILQILSIDLHYSHLHLDHCVWKYWEHWTVSMTKYRASESTSRRVGCHFWIARNIRLEWIPCCGEASWSWRWGTPRSCGCSGSHSFYLQWGNGTSCT